MIGRAHALVVLAGLAVTACAPTDAPGSGGSSGTGADATTAPGVETKPWDVETESSPALMTSDTGMGDDSAPATTTTSGGAVDGEEDTAEDADGEEEGEREDFVGLYGWGTAVLGESYASQGEAVVFVGGVEGCIAVWSATAVPDTTCPECSFAYRLTIDTVEVEEDVNCAEYGFTAEALAGRQFAVGVQGNDGLALDDGDGWIETDGWGEFVEDRGVFEWELPSEVR